MNDDMTDVRVEGALDFLVQASRVSPVLRAKVQIVEDEIRRLRRWQSEATTVLNYWDIAYEMANIDGRLGDSKPTLMLTEIERLRAECDRFRQHSVLLNCVAWQVHQALGAIPEGADEHWGDIEQDLPRICELVRKGLDKEAPDAR